jgi:regulator of cell morphogenesis and NO signaling
MEIRSQTRVADVATEYPATIRVFQRYGIDFCCGGKRALRDVCDEKNVKFDQLKEDLDVAVTSPRDQGPAWHAWSVTEVITGILDRYHRPLDEELPRLAQMMQKVLSVHGERHPELVEVSEIFGTIRNELRPHMRKEEQMLFPYLVRMEAVALAGAALGREAQLGSVAGPIAAMEADHEDVGRGLVALRERTTGYRAPADACNTFRGLYHGFEELERSLHEHIHVENNILFPRAAQVEAGLLGRARARG